MSDLREELKKITMEARISEHKDLVGCLLKRKCEESAKAGRYYVDITSYKTTNGKSITKEDISIFAEENNLNLQQYGEENFRISWE